MKRAKKPKQPKRMRTVRAWAVVGPSGYIGQYYANGLPVIHKTRYEAMVDREWECQRVARVEIREASR